MGEKVLRGRTPLASLHRVLSFALAACGVLCGAARAHGQAPPDAAPAEQPSADQARLIEYTVIRGESCDSIVGKLYGDPKKIELLHQNNPQLGPTPHTLVPGQKLRLPPPTAGPDARLSFTRNDVDAFTPDRHDARPGEPLMRGHRVSTAAGSSAVITFRDQTRLQLGENTLVVVLGDSSDKSARSGTSADTTLANGSLRAHLGALAGDKPLALETPGANVALGTGEAQVQVDGKRATRVSVYRGESKLKAAGKEVSVPEGYGSRAEKGQPPTKPKRLPPAPVWRSAPKVIGAKGLTVDVSGTYGPAPGLAAITGWHVQLARDAQFNDLLLDSRVPRKVMRFDALELAPGEYFVRVSAVDPDSFESPPSQSVHFAVSPVRIESVGPLRSQVKVPKGLFCGVGDAPLTAVTGPFEIQTSRPRRLRCSTKNDGSGIVETTIPPSSLGKVNVRANLVPAAARREGQVEVTVRDANEQPMDDVEVSASASEGVTVGGFKPAGKPGTYAAAVTWKAGQRSFPLRFVVAGAEPLEPTTLDVKDIPEARPEPKAPPAPRKLAFEVGVLGGVALGGPALSGPAVAAEVGVRYPAGPVVLALALRPGYERYVWNGSACAAGIECVTEANLFALALPLSVRFRPADSFWSPYVSIVPALLAEFSSTHAFGTTQDGQHIRFGAGGLAGFELRYHRFGFFAEAGGRYTTPGGGYTAQLALPWFVGSLGVRATL
jgi:hypothetical protein